MPIRSKSEAGQAMLEFAVVAISLTFLFAGAFTVGAMLNKDLQVSNVTRSGAVLMVRAVTDPNSDLNLALTQNQRILIREASGLGMARNSSFDPDPNGNGAIFLSKIIMVGATECAAAGLTPHTSAPLWDTGNCANFGSYAWAYYVAVGNSTKWASAFGTPLSTDIQTDGSVTAVHIATAAAMVVPSAKVTSAITLASSQYALISETYADISSVAVFGYWKPPIVYYRTIT